MNPAPRGATQLREIILRAGVVVIGLPVVLTVVAGASFYAVMSFYAPNRIGTATQRAAVAARPVRGPGLDEPMGELRHQLPESA